MKGGKEGRDLERKVERKLESNFQFWSSRSGSPTSRTTAFSQQFPPLNEFLRNGFSEFIWKQKKGWGLLILPSVSTFIKFKKNMPWKNMPKHHDRMIKYLNDWQEFCSSVFTQKCDENLLLWIRAWFSPPFHHNECFHWYKLERVIQQKQTRPHIFNAHLFLQLQRTKEKKNVHTNQSELKQYKFFFKLKIKTEKINRRWNRRDWEEQNV